MLTYGIILQLVVVSLLLADSSGQTYADNMWRQFVSETPSDLETLYSYADDTFGPDNWSHEIIDQTVETYDDLASVQCRSTVRISLRDGMFHEGIDYTYLANYEFEQNVVEYQQKSLTKAFYNALMSFRSARFHAKKMNNHKFNGWEEEKKAKRQKFDNMLNIMSLNKKEAAKLEYEHFNEHLLRANQRRSEELMKEKAKETLKDILLADKIKQEERLRKKLENDTPWPKIREEERLTKRQAKAGTSWPEKRIEEERLREKVGSDISRRKRSEEEKFKDQKLKEDKFRHDESKKHSVTKDKLIEVKSIDNNLKTEKSVDKKIEEKKINDSKLKESYVKDDPSKHDRLKEDKLKEEKSKDHKSNSQKSID